MGDWGRQATQGLESLEAAASVAEVSKQTEPTGPKVDDDPKDETRTLTSLTGLIQSHLEVAAPIPGPPGCFLNSMSQF